MSKSANPFPKEFPCTGISYNYRGQQVVTNYIARSYNGWYRLYRAGSWSYDGCYRYWQLENRIRNGTLFIGGIQQEDEGNFSIPESII